MNGRINRGDMYYADLSQGIGSEQSGCRPILIIQNDIGNKYSGTVIIAVITSKKINKAKLPTHYPVKAQQGLVRDSLVLLEQLRTIDKSRLKKYIGTLNTVIMEEVDNALKVSVGLKNQQKTEREENYG